MAFTLVGPNTYPSAADTLFNNAGPAGPIAVTAQGLGLQDGFTRVQVLLAVCPRPQR